MKKNNKVTIKETKISKSDEFTLQSGDIITQKNGGSTLVVSNVAHGLYNLISISDDFHRWDDISMTLEELTKYVKESFLQDRISIYRNSSIDITLSKKVN